MVKINRESVENFLGPLAEDGFDVKVSLFVVSPKNQRLKMLNLKDLSPEEREKKLSKWSKEDRFVAVIEIGDRVFAHMHKKHALILQDQKDLSLNGKKIELRSLTDKESLHLNAVGLAFEKHLLGKDEEQKKEAEEAGLFRPEYFASRRLLSDWMQPHHFLIGQMVKNKLGKIILNAIRQFSESNRELEKQRDQDEKKLEIVKAEIKKEILRSEITAGEIRQQEQNQKTLKTDEKQVKRSRGEF